MARAESLRVCLLTDQDLDGGSFPDDDWPCDPRPFLPEAEWEVAVLEKPTAVRQIAELSRRDFDLLFNLCDGAWDEDRPGIEVVQVLERLGIPFTGATSEFYEPSREAMKSAVTRAAPGSSTGRFHVPVCRRRQKTEMRRALPIVLLTAVLVSCAYPYGGVRDPWGGPWVDGWVDPHVPSDERDRRDPREGVARKKVTAKQEHTLLIAYDGSECQVSPERWKKIAVGDASWCYWRVEDGDLERPRARRGS